MSARVCALQFIFKIQALMLMPKCDRFVNVEYNIVISVVEILLKL